MADIKRKKYYVVVIGRQPGVYTSWSGDDGAEAQVKHYPGARFKSFGLVSQALEWLSQYEVPAVESIRSQLLPLVKDDISVNSSPSHRYPEDTMLRSNEELTETLNAVVMYTDGGCLHNPGPGGYAALIDEHGQVAELAGGYRRTTNNRMELKACVVGLQSLVSPRNVNLYTDSFYVINGITRGWAKRWKDKGWMRTESLPARNVDLWSLLLELTELHCVQFHWVRGHSGDAYNERCDQLARAAAGMLNLPPDDAFERDEL